MAMPDWPKRGAWPLMAVLGLIAVLTWAAPGAWAKPLRLVALGDSLVQGFGLPPEDGFVPQLERWLRRSGLDVEVVNAGVSGDTTRGGRSRIGWAMNGRPDALIVALGGNDALRGIDPGEVRGNLEAILSVATENGPEVLLVGIAAPGNFGPQYAREFNAIYPELAEKYDVALHENFLAALANLPDRAETLETFFQADALHPNKRGVAKIVEDIGPQVKQLLERAERKRAEDDGGG